MEADFWWTLPGPRRFLRRIGEDVEEGRNVILVVPEQLGDGRWCQRLRAAGAVRSRDLLPAADIRTCAAPGGVVLRHFLPPGTELRDVTAASVCDAAARAFDLATADGAHPGTTLALLECGTDWPAWDAWSRFLGEWADASRNKALASRIVFIAVVAGCAAQRLPADRDSLRVRQWAGATDDSDILAYSYVAFADWQSPPLERRVAATVSASLAIWDTDVVDVLADGEFQSVLRPGAVLRRLAQDRHWTSSDLRRGTSWHAGHRKSPAATATVHSAALAILGENETIDSRVWAGQVGVLLPFIEELRLRIIRSLEPLLQIPWVTKFGSVDDVRDLEIGHLHDQIAERRLPVDPAIRLALPLLRSMRNKLAHLEVVDADLLRDERLVSLQVR